MSVNEQFVDAPPTAVWDVLADAPSYEEWVVGNKEIRSPDPGWPAPGTQFGHKVGFGPVAVKDKTVSLESQPRHRLMINVRVLPAGHGIVTFELQEEGSGTLVRMEEQPAGGPAKYTWPLLDPLVKLRNVETLRRLARVAETRHRAGV
jgi:uncharacterized protein YndB with AHSA1/START domain